MKLKICKASPAVTNTLVESLNVSGVTLNWSMKSAMRLYKPLPMVLFGLNSLLMNRSMNTSEKPEGDTLIAGRVNISGLVRFLPSR